MNTSGYLNEWTYGIFIRQRKSKIMQWFKYLPITIIIAKPNMQTFHITYKTYTHALPSTVLLDGYGGKDIGWNCIP